MTTENDINRRNERLLKFFQFLGYEVKLHGNNNCPAVIRENKTVLSCYVHNFNLIFTNKPKNGEELFRLKLNADMHENLSDQTTNLLLNWLLNAEHRECYSIKTFNTNLRLAGFNFFDKENKIGEKYPVFAEHNFKIFFDKSYAEDIVKSFSSPNTLLQVI